MDLTIRPLKIQIATGVQTDFGWLRIPRCALKGGNDTSDIT